jgi:hypothetical protein
MKKITILVTLMVSSLGFSQTKLPLTFTNADQLMTGGDLSVVSLVADPLNSQNQVLQIVGDPAQSYDTASLVLSTPINLEDNASNTITFRINPINIVGVRNHILKFEVPGGVEKNFTTTDSGWQDITVDFGSGLVAYSKILIFTDAGSSNAGTYLVDDIAGATNKPLSILTLPLRFKASNELFSEGGTTTSLVADPLDSGNQVLRIDGSAGADYNNASLSLNPGVNLSDDAHNTITFRINPVGVTGVHHHALKFEGPGAVEYEFETTGSGWQTISANFGTGKGTYSKIVFFPDFKSSDTGIYLVDDIEFSSQLLLDAEDGTTNKLVTMNVFANGPGQSNTDMIVVNNPDRSGVNTSEKCIQFTRRTTGNDAMPWAGFFSSVADPDPDFTINKYVHVKIWKSNTSGVKFKIEGGPAGTSEILSDNDYKTPGVWQDMVFDFSDKFGVYPIVALLPDFEDPLTAGGDRIIYFDDIIVNNIATPRTLGIKANVLTSKISVYPNPAKEVLRVQTSESLSSATIYSTDGRKVLTINKFEKGTTSINTSSLSNGVYLINFISTSGVNLTKQFIKQ